jgi:hypothetical protein
MSSPLPTIDMGLVEKLAMPLLRPTLHIAHEGKRITEEVAVRYPAGIYDVFSSPGSTATVTSTRRGGETGRARYIRAWVHNLVGFPARRCQVFVDEISLDGETIDDERSPLHWADIDGAYELPQIRRGRRNGAYIDICSVDSVHPETLQVISLKWTKGYHRFNRRGDYMLRLSAEANKPCSFGKMNIVIRHDGTWQNARVVKVESGRKLSRWI